MRKPLLFSLITVTLILMTSMAAAEKFYFYKEVGKELPRGQRYDSHYIPKIKDKLPGGLFVSFSLPGEPRNTHNEFTMSFSCAVDPKSNDPSTYLFFIEDLAIWDGEGMVYLLRIDPNPDALTDAGAAKLPPHRVKVIRQNRTIDGRIKSQYPVEVAMANETVDVKLIFNASALPKHLFIDYRFRIHKEGGPAEILEGTIPMELVSYNVSWWEKTRY